MITIQYIIHSMKHNYCCIRCGYETLYKSSMYDHFYKKRKPCPMLVNVIELNDEIKQHILDNYIYIIPINQNEVQNDKTLIQTHNDINKQIITTINTNNTINNLITNMDVLDKMKKYMDHKQIELVNFEDKVESKYVAKVKRLDTDSYKYGFQLSSDDFLEIINEISNICNGESFEHFNILYDNKIKKLKLYEQGTWEEMLLNSGIKKIIQTIQDYYLNSYEQYLMRTLSDTNTSCIKRQQCKEHLQEYYTFIGAFEIPAYVQNMQSNNIEENIIDKYWKLYTTTRDNLKRCEINKTKRDVVDILKRNTIRNIQEMNKKVLDLFKIDEVFKQTMLQEI